jgi:branched-chain amino acid:cation transporter, LIVCS family
MNKNAIPLREMMAIGLMLFALFFGAGNMIFPPYLGQQAGSNLWPAIIGFLLTGVGLPLLGIMAVAKTGDLILLSKRVHPLFGLIFPFILYLTIGPFFGLPRTGTVAYEMSISPFLTDSMVQSQIPLFLYSIGFFGVTAWLSLNPTKLVDRIGKILTPALIIIISFLVIKSFITPLGKMSVPQNQYVNNAFFKGFIEGYLTLDALGALVFGIVVIGSIRERGITNSSTIARASMIAGTIAALGLAIVYVSLSYIGATSIEGIGASPNGAALLSDAAIYLFGTPGQFILGIAITLACLTTSIGLVSSCSQYFVKVFPRFSYRQLVFSLSFFSLVVSNFGLDHLISFSLPVLMMIYPIAIVLILLSHFHKLFRGKASVYIFALVPTAFMSLAEGLMLTGVKFGIITTFISMIPLYNQGIAWAIPAALGALLGYFIR